MLLSKWFPFFVYFFVETDIRRHDQRSIYFGWCIMLFITVGYVVSCSSSIGFLLFWRAKYVLHAGHVSDIPGKRLKSHFVSNCDLSSQVHAIHSDSYIYFLCFAKIYNRNKNESTRIDKLRWFNLRPCYCLYITFVVSFGIYDEIVLL